MLEDEYNLKHFNQINNKKTSQDKKLHTTSRLGRCASVLRTILKDIPNAVYRSFEDSNKV